MVLRENCSATNRGAVGGVSAARQGAAGNKARSNAVVRAFTRASLASGRAGYTGWGVGVTVLQVGMALSRRRRLFRAVVVLAVLLIVAGAVLVAMRLDW